MCAPLPSVYSPRPALSGVESPAQRYDPASARQWLTFLARWLARDGVSNLAWWHLHRAAPLWGVRSLPGL